MDNKLSELKRRAEKCPIKRFKPFIGKANTQATLCADTGIEIIGWSGFDASDLNAKSHRVELARFIAAADPETILALLAELEAKDKLIIGLERHVKDIEATLIAATDEISDLEKERDEARAKLATPVINSVDSDPQREHFGCSVRTTDSGTFYITRLGSVPGREMALYRNEAEALFLGLREALSAGFTVEGDE